MARLTAKDLINDSERMIFNHNGYMGLPPGSDAVRTFRGSKLSDALPEDLVLFATALNKKKEAGSQSVIIKALDSAKDDVRLADPQMFSEYEGYAELIVRGDERIHEISTIALAQALESIRKRQDNQS